MEHEYFETLKKKACEELYDFAKKSSLSASDWESIRILSDTIKNFNKIEVLEDEGGYSEARGRSNRGGYSRDGGEWEAMGSYDDGSSYRRGRGRNARRDSMGRYSSDDGSSYDRYSEGNSYRGYSRDGAKDMMLEQIEEMMESADSPKQREALQKCMASLKNA